MSGRLSGLLGEAFEGKQDLPATSLEGEEDAESLRVAVGTNLVDVTPKMSCFTKTMARDAPHLLKNSCGITIPKRFEEVAYRTATSATLVETPSALWLRIHQPATLSPHSDTRARELQVWDDRPKDPSRAVFFDHRPFAFHVHPGQLMWCARQDSNLQPPDP
jgi:hypothetical protein